MDIGQGTEAKSGAFHRKSQKFSFDPEPVSALDSLRRIQEYTLWNPYSSMGEWQEGSSVQNGQGIML